MAGPGAPPRRSADDDWARIRAWVQLLLGGVAASALVTGGMALAGLLNSQVDGSELRLLVGALGVVLVAGVLVARSAGRFTLDDRRPWVPATAGALVGALSSIATAIFSAAFVFYGG